MTTYSIRQPTRDLCADLRIESDGELGDTENVCAASNRQLRLYVGGWMLADEDSPAGYARGLARALELYQGCGRNLLEAPGRLTTAGIAVEMAQLVPADPENDGR